jgi:hypothetical protein
MGYKTIQEQLLFELFWEPNTSGSPGELDSTLPGIESLWKIGKELQIVATELSQKDYDADTRDQIIMKYLDCLSKIKQIHQAVLKSSWDRMEKRI